MKLPPNFARQWIKGTGKGNSAVNGWAVRAGGRAVFIPLRCVSYPGAVRKRLESVLGVVSKPDRTQEELIVARERQRAQQRRSFRNNLARGKNVTPPWAVPRTVRVVANEERALDIAQRWQRMGEFKR